MKIVNVLVDHGRFANRSAFYPLFRWKRELLAYGIKMNFFYSIDSIKKDSDILILSSRYFRAWQDIGKRNQTSSEQIISVLKRLSGKTGKLIWFDLADTTGSTDFGIIPFVDEFWKKQLLKDTSQYLFDDKGIVRIWLPESVQKEYKRNTSFEYIPCHKKDLEKIKLAWSIGYNDYRFSNKYLSHLSLLMPGYFKKKPRIVPVELKQIDIINRGSYNKTNLVYSYQRNQTFTELEVIKNKYPLKNIIDSGFVKRSKYNHELKMSRMALSPFGWGEVCYKDFEIILAGTLMLKPSMNHLITFPDVYLENETYLPLKWDMSDLCEVVEQAFDNYSLSENIAVEALQVYLEQYNNSAVFCDHFANLIQ